MKHRDMWGLARIALAFEWLEALFSVITGPGLVAFGLVAPVALFTGVELLRWGWLSVAWALAMAGGLDIWLVVASGYLIDALYRRQWGPAAAWAALVVALAGIGFQANWVIMFASSQGVSNAAALAQLGISDAVWTLERAALVPFLVIVSALIRRVVAAGGHAATQAPAPEVAPAPAASPAIRAAGLRNPKGSKKPPVIRLASASGGRGVPQSVEAKARAAWRPGMGVPALQEAAGISRPSAQKYHAKFTAETGAERAAV